ncbi:MAG: nucleotidyl transferase AbiEii/AbiGii toxin family protein [Treponema sp.]|jgi:hypothetical protein|nr:nucleotidyl transferase AbiEii/AbiGii toxin family protein [Treponema sp.]
MLCKEAVSCELIEIITDLQKEQLFSKHILAGGTALALQLGHRKSFDIDLFTLEKQDNEKNGVSKKNNFNFGRKRI